ncbi:MAG: DUF4831 family protein [Bacteroidales bacterium]|nr:DUF4831 family protein [Bacteroidales bacterium]
MKKFLFLFPLVLLSTCSPFTKISITNVNNVGSTGPSSCLYALPLSCVAVTVVARQESFVPGPYYMYAGKYLGITDVVTKPHEKWTLMSASVSHYTETDPDFLFSVNSTGRSSYLKIIGELHKDSLILLPGNFTNRRVFENKYTLPTEPLIFKDLSVKRNFEADKDIIVSDILPDSSYPQPHVSKGKADPVIKTTEQKAEEAANFIIKIRKRRFKLISGQYDYMPDGEALGRAVDELNNIEAEYISLFIGKRSSSTLTRTFYYIPESNTDIARTILFRFSTTEGFMEAGENGGKPVLADIKDLNKTSGFGTLVINPKGSGNQLFYRIPDQAFMRILYGEQVLYEARFPVYQFGSLVAISLRGRK